jgi:hypothetical protein
MDGVCKVGKKEGQTGEEDDSLRTKYSFKKVPVVKILPEHTL